MLSVNVIVISVEPDDAVDKEDDDDGGVEIVYAVDDVNVSFAEVLVGEVVEEAELADEDVPVTTLSLDVKETTALSLDDKVLDDAGNRVTVTVFSGCCVTLTVVVVMLTITEDVKGAEDDVLGIIVVDAKEDEISDAVNVVVESRVTEDPLSKEDGDDDCVRVVLMVVELPGADVMTDDPSTGEYVVLDEEEELLESLLVAVAVNEVSVLKVSVRV